MYQSMLQLGDENGNVFKHSVSTQFQVGEECNVEISDLEQLGNLISSTEVDKEHKENHFGKQNTRPKRIQQFERIFWYHMIIGDTVKTLNATIFQTPT